MTSPPLSDAEIEQFVQRGYVHLARAFPRDVAAEGRRLLWALAKEELPGLDEHDPSTWTRAVIRLGGSGAPPFRQATNTRRITAAFDQIVGPGRWKPHNGIGRFPIRFPSPEPIEDGGWHIDASIPVGDTWHANLTSHHRALLMLFLFSDVDERSGPTRIRVGSHLDVARMLEPFGDEGVHHGTVAARIPELETREIALATGRAGDVYLCHPFLVHAANHNRGRQPRFLANPSLPSAGPLVLDRADGDYSPVERAVLLGLGRI